MNEVLPWHSAQWQRYVSMTEAGRLPHALLLAGPRGIGLAEFAACVTANLHCLEPPAGGIACGNCRSCVLLAAGNHPDLFRAEPEEPGGPVKVDRVRELIDFIQLSSQFGRYKIAWIQPAEAMNRSAANGLLKTLEEPPGQSLLILISHQPSRLPITLRSRCQRLEFHTSRNAETGQWLARHLPDSTIDPANVLELAGGAPLWALELADPERLARYDALLEDMRRMGGEPPVDPAHLAEQWLALGAAETLETLSSYLATAARLKLGGGPRGNRNSNVHKHLQQLADELDLSDLVACYDIAVTNRQRATGPFNLNPQGLLEEVIVRWQTILEHKGGGVSERTRGS